MSSAATFAAQQLVRDQELVRFDGGLDSEAYREEHFQQDKSAGGLPKVTIHTGRPAFGPLFDLIESSHRRGGTPPTGFVDPPQSKTVAIYACGPQELVDDAQAYAMAKSWHLHKESFKL